MMTDAARRRRRRRRPEPLSRFEFGLWCATFGALAGFIACLLMAARMIETGVLP